MIESLSSHASLSSSHFSGGKFCPAGGMVGSRSGTVPASLRNQLQQRLKIAAWILFAGSLSFCLLSFFTETNGAIIHEPIVLIPHCLSLCVLLVCGLILTTQPHIPYSKLRLLEYLVFGSKVAYFVWYQFSRVHWALLSDPAFAQSFPAQTLIPWLILIQVYGLFIPNSNRRAIVITLFFACMPLIVAGAAAMQHEALAVELRSGAAWMMLTIMSVGAAAMIYGSHRLEKLTQQVQDAKQVGLYTLKEKLGSGGMGDVYLAEHHLLKRPCAIKLIQADKTSDCNAVNRFQQEVHETSQLTHPHTIEIYDYGYTETGTFYYVMEHLPGLSLQTLVNEYGPMSPDRVVFLLRQVCSALAEAHARGLIHRDLKPANIFAAERGGLYDYAKLLDFGLVKASHSDADSLELTQVGTVVGSPLYAAPESILESVLDARSDIYSLGATAWFLLTGEAVFTGTNPVKVLFAHAHEAPRKLSELNTNVPPELEQLIAKCLAKNPADRFQTVEELELALAECPCEWSRDSARNWWQAIEDNQEQGTSEKPVLEPTLVMALDSTPHGNNDAGMTFNG